MTPTTKSGRALLDDILAQYDRSPAKTVDIRQVRNDLRVVIREARADEAEALRAALDKKVTAAVVDALMAEEVGEGHYRWQFENIVSPAIRAALATPAAPVARDEGRCDRCGGVNVVWWAPHHLWNATGRHDGADEWPFLCPSCFATVAEQRGVVPAHTVWHMVPDGEVAQRTEQEASTLPVAGSTPALPTTPAAPVADKESE